ncbi:hypothetical protein [Dyadobacter frigoris]|uniref:Uncharacterized protein n=1 Tax=Dyadobacter frigoris TaxID=2576211 RepID=A0A4U6DCJ2_9BACT|nr:hypothetical protein [Dyadobacter frigoris]TKT94211.1 hypothetical protein FDK13_03085 [Dyadobacter frigoris]GLU50599.1 hypothetical protein Dfri01_00600 [Dyadobacter frigoris]
MSKKNLHIKKYLSGKLPEPEVQVDDAWAQMNDMLSETSAPDPLAPEAGKFKYLLKYGLGFLSGVAIVAGSWLLLPENNKIKTTLKSNLEEKRQDSIELNDALEEVKPNVAENLIIGEDSLQDNSTGIENNIITDSLPNDKIHSKQFTDTKNQSVNSGLTNQSEIRLPYTKTNSESKENDRNKLTPLVPESDHFENTIKKKINIRIVSNRLPESNRKNARLVTSKEKESGSNTFEKSFNTAKSRSSYFEQKNSSQENTNEIKSGKIIFSVKNLVSKSTRFPGPGKNRIVTIPVKSEIKKEENKKVKSKKPLLETIHIGLEWNASSSFKNTKYILSGADSINRPYLLLIPGLWLSKDFSEKQSVTASFFAYQSYFGGNKLINQRADSVFTATKNTNMIKAVGLNLSLQYNYRFYSNWAVSGGVSYSKLRKALFQENLQNYAGIIIPVSMVTLKKPDLTNFIQTNLISFKTGIIFNPGRYQLGANLIVPLTNVSVTSTPLKTLNGQIFFRFQLK